MAQVTGRARYGGPGPRRCPEPARAADVRGQAAVELAMVLVPLAVLLLVLVQAGLVVRDQVLVVHAARDAARLASTGVGPGEVEDRVQRALPGAEVDIDGGDERGDPVRVEVRYRSHTDLPLVGSWLPDVDLRQAATMRAET